MHIDSDGNRTKHFRNLKESYKYQIIAVRKPQSLNKYWKECCCWLNVKLSSNRTLIFRDDVLILNDNEKMDRRCKNKIWICNLYFWIVRYIPIVVTLSMITIYVCLDMSFCCHQISRIPQTLYRNSFFFSFLFKISIPFCINFNCLPLFVIFPMYVWLCTCALPLTTTFEWLLQYLNCAVKLNTPYRNSFRFISIHRHYVRFLQHLWCLFSDLRVFEIDVYILLWIKEKETFI